MSTYHVSFFKYLLSSDGHPFKCLQRRIDVNDAESAAQATEICVESVRSAVRMSLETPCGFHRGQRLRTLNRVRRGLASCAI